MQEDDEASRRAAQVEALQRLQVKSCIIVKDPRCWHIGQPACPTI